MKAVFIGWGGLGFVPNVLLLLDLIFSREITVGTSTWATAVVLTWIGGTIFFGFGAVIENTATAAPGATDNQKQSGWRVR
jgi:hypothetical protein